MYNTEGALTRLRLRKDYPEPGDACLVNFQEIDGSNQEYMQILRNEDRLGRIRVVTMFSTPTSQLGCREEPWGLQDAPCEEYGKQLGGKNKSGESHESQLV